mgnify:FL=1
MKLAEEYLAQLESAYRDSGEWEEWLHFYHASHGASAEDLAALRCAYPDLPDSLADLLSLVDGSYFRDYGGEKFAVYMLGSDIPEYPYYLLSAAEMLAEQTMIADTYDFFWEPDFRDVLDERISDTLSGIRWLHFSDCMNNGGTSQLFIDFTPSPKGKKGQIVRFLHDPDEFAVIADSFDDYLWDIMAARFDFI